MIRNLICLILALCLGAGHAPPLAAREAQTSYKEDVSQRFQQQLSTAQPQVIRTAHSRGNIRLAVANNGTFGTFGEIFLDPFSNEPLPSCEYPRGSDIVFLYIAALWIGAGVDGDTLVSCGSEDFYQTDELWPDRPELGGQFRYGSIDIN